jgi:hypothetical protein
MLTPLSCDVIVRYDIHLLPVVHTLRYTNGITGTTSVKLHME